MKKKSSRLLQKKKKMTSKRNNRQGSYGPCFFIGKEIIIFALLIKSGKGVIQLQAPAAIAIRGDPLRKERSPSWGTPAYEYAAKPGISCAFVLEYNMLLLRGRLESKAGELDSKGRKLGSNRQ